MTSNSISSNPLYAGMTSGPGVNYPLYANQQPGAWDHPSYPGAYDFGSPSSYFANLSGQSGYTGAASLMPRSSTGGNSAPGTSPTSQGSKTDSKTKTPTGNGGYPLTFTTDGRLAYIQPGDDLNNPKNVIYADPLPAQSGPNGESVYLTPQPDSKMIYIGKDDQKRDVIKYIDPAEQAKADLVYSQQAMKDGIPGFDPRKDMQFVIDHQKTTLHEAVKKESNESLTEQDWQEIASGKHDDILTVKIPDEQERLKVKITAMSMVDQIEKAKSDIKSPINALKILASKDGDRLFKMANPNEKRKTREMFEKIASGWTPEGLNAKDAATFEKVREAVRYSLCVNITDPKYFNEMKKHGTGGGTLFQYLDNSNSSKDNNGNFGFQNYGAALFHFGVR